jgi:hypothetical protein
MYEVNLKELFVTCAVMRVADTLGRQKSIHLRYHTALEIPESDLQRRKFLNGHVEQRTYCGDLKVFSVILLRLGNRSILLMGIRPTSLIFLQEHTDLVPLSS